MPIIIDYFDYFKKTLVVQKQAQILKQIKKEAKYTPKLREGASDTSKITDLRLDDDGTVSTYLEGEKYPNKSSINFSKFQFDLFRERV